VKDLPTNSNRLRRIFGPVDKVAFGTGDRLGAKTISGDDKFAVDATGVYWVNPTAMTIRHCPVDGCPPGGAGYVARNLPGVVNLTLGEGFAYFRRGNRIYKLAKP
jgi:hypothetical protein